MKEVRLVFLLQDFLVADAEEKLAQLRALLDEVVVEPGCVAKKVFLAVYLNQKIVALVLQLVDLFL